MLDKQPGFYLHEKCMLYGDLHERLMPFLTLKNLCKTLLSEYTNDEMIINESSPIILRDISYSDDKITSLLQRRRL